MVNFSASTFYIHIHLKRLWATLGRFSKLLTGIASTEKCTRISSKRCGLFLALIAASYIVCIHVSQPNVSNWTVFAAGKQCVGSLETPSALILKNAHIDHCAAHSSATAVFRVPVTKEFHLDNINDVCRITHIQQKIVEAKPSDICGKKNKNIKIQQNPSRIFCQILWHCLVWI